MNLSVLQAHKDIVTDLTDVDQRRSDWMALVTEAERGHTPAISLLEALVRYEKPWAFSWLLDKGEERPYFIFEALRKLSPQLSTHLLWEAALSSEPLMPYDYRALAFTELNEVISHKKLTSDSARLARVRTLAHMPLPWRFRTDEEKLRLPTDGIDHLFDVPESLGAKLEILKVAAMEGLERQQAILCARFLRALNLDVSDTRFFPGLRNLEVETLVSRDVSCKMVEAQDYLVAWDHVIERSPCQLTIAELTRLILFSEDLQLPSPKTRMALLAFHRAWLKTGGRSIIGLRAGPFHVEHGSLAIPSYFYMGRDSALGKGCVVDNIGGAVILSEAFLGGGFMPILIHTHKHIRRSGQSAIQERQQIRPGIFVAESGVRLPMSQPGILEMVDYLHEPFPVPGISCYPIHSHLSPVHRRIQQ